MPLDTVAESSARPACMVPTATMGGGDSGRPFMLKSLEAPGKFSGLKHIVATTWVTDMSCWICLSKVRDDYLWDVVATHMIGGTRT